MPDQPSNAPEDPRSDGDASAREPLSRRAARQARTSEGSTSPENASPRETETSAGGGKATGSVDADALPPTQKLVLPGNAESGDSATTPPITKSPKKKSPDTPAHSTTPLPTTPPITKPRWSEPTPHATDSEEVRQASLDELFAAEPPEARPLLTAPRSRKRLWIGLAIVLFVLAGIGYGVSFAWSTYEPQIREAMGWTEPKDYEAGIAEGEAFVTISEGDNGQAISQSLYKAGVTKTPEAFYNMLIDSGENPPFYPGLYTLQLKMTSAAALKALQDPEKKSEHAVLLREGLTVKASLETISESLAIPLEDLTAAVADPSAYGVNATNLEGWLFPALYTFDPGVTATDVISRLVQRTLTSLDEEGVAPEDRQKVLTIASIIQREARLPDDFFKVSRVIQNRLDVGQKLEMDSTAQYGYGESRNGSVFSSGAALTDDNPYNTYVITGLPAGPIANPGDVAIDAALRPVDGDWLYFVTVNLNTGETVFNVTYEDHLKSVEDLRAWCSANPDSGC